MENTQKIISLSEIEKKRENSKCEACGVDGIEKELNFTNDSQYLCFNCFLRKDKKCL